MSGISPVVDHGDGDQFTPDMWKSLEDNLNDGVVAGVGCKLHRSGDINGVATGTSQTVTWSDVDMDQDNMFDLADAAKVTFNTAGWYSGVAALNFSGGANGNNREVYVRKNGDNTQIIARNSRGPNGASNAVHVGCPFTEYFVVGDYIEVIGVHDAGVNLSLTAVDEYGSYLRVARH